MHKKSGIFKYKTQTVYRQITATNTQVDFPRQHYHTDFSPFLLTLETTDEYWKLANNASSTFEGQTASLTDAVNVSGNAPTFPKMYLVFNTATSVTSISFACNDRTITLSQAISAGEVVILNGVDRTVTVDGVQKTYTGTFPKFESGENYFDVTIDGTFDVDMVFVYPVMYL